MANDDRRDESRLDKSRHVQYWKRCLKTYLPSQYTSNDSNRMYLAYFIVSALELLDELRSSMSENEQAGYIDWIYRCQHAKGGFRMWPGTDFGERASPENAGWDPGHIPATYFALTTLVSLGDDLGRVRKVETLRWLATMQRQDGSFGETIVNGKIEGGRDPRFGYCAAAIRNVLRGMCSQDESAEIDNIDVVGLQQAVVAGQAYDGGIADAAHHEPQAGYTFCALGTLDLLGVLHHQHDNPVQIDHGAVAKWLVDRQTDLIDPDADQPGPLLNTAALSGQANASSPFLQVTQLPYEVTSDRLQPPQVSAAGMNGRPNKVADTCYAWWVEASLHMLGLAQLYHRPAVRSYLLDLTQQKFMGGFTKFPGDKYADIYHSFMGLAALSLASTAEQRRLDGIKEWDATMCVSIDVRRQLRSLSDTSR